MSNSIKFPQTCFDCPSSSTAQDDNYSSCDITMVRPHLVTALVGILIILLLLISIIVLILVLQRRKTRYSLEGGSCNLPTVMWTPKFWNYSIRDDAIDAMRREKEDNVDWYDDKCVLEWAQRMLVQEYTHRNQKCTPNQKQPYVHRICKKKLGSSSITNILPRMERLDGPYGMYATVYGIRTKVVHVGHHVPARAILTGAGVIELDGLCESLRRTRSLSQFEDNSVKKTIRRSSSSSMRLLTGSTKNPAYDHFKNFSGEGVFTANGSDWKAKRASVIHCLLRNSHTETRLGIEANKAADSFIREVQHATEIGQHGKRNDDLRSVMMNVVPMLQRSTVGLTYRLLTHHDVDFSPTDTEESMKKSVENNPTYSPRSSASSLASMGEDEDCTPLQKYEPNIPFPKNDEQQEQIKQLLQDYLQSVTRIRMIVLAQSRSIWFLLPRWMYQTFSPMYREEERTMLPIRKFSQQACENAVPESPVAQLRQRDSHSSKSIAALSPNVSKDLLDETITLLFAGQDTSAATLSWTLHLLSLHPDKQEKLAKEIRSVVGDTRCGIISKSMTSQMPYLDAVIKESMRLYPVAPFIVRKLTSDITIPADETQSSDGSSPKEAVTLPAYTFACIWIYALHRNPKLWDKPDDFLPERWIESSLQSWDLGQNEHGAYMPFAIGPRNCLGQALAQVILRIVLARIINEYVVIDPKLEALRRVSKLEKIEFDPHLLRKDMEAGFTVLPSNGLQIQLDKRK